MISHIYAKQGNKTDECTTQNKTEPVELAKWDGILHENSVKKMVCGRQING